MTDQTERVREIRENLKDGYSAWPDPIPSQVFSDISDLLTHISQLEQKVECETDGNKGWFAAYMSMKKQRDFLDSQLVKKIFECPKCARLEKVVDAARRINYGVLISKLLDANVVLPEITLRLSTLANAVGDLTKLDKAEEEK